MRNNFHYFLRSLVIRTQSIPVVYLLAVALLLIVLGSVACSSQPVTDASQSTPPLTLPAEVTDETQNPLPDLTAAAAAGKPLYQANCALCHGETGESDGPASASFDPRPATLTQGEITTLPDGKLFSVTKNGKGKMPPMKKMTDEQIWQTIAYIRTLAKK